jgi:eukaryotic-like serine/threonine-protein kinase
MWLPDRTLRHLRDVAGWPEFASDRYEVRTAIGRGGMGTVYAAFDHALGREVAIKIGNALPSTELQARLTREAKIIASLEHPAIVPVHDFGLLADGRPFYVMKRVNGRTLQACIDAGVPLAERLRIYERVCEAVGFAHAHGVIHRDLKPENVMVGEFGDVMVMDWGVARARGAEPAAALGDDHIDMTAAGTHPGTVLGTPGFMPPEQSRADDVDERADVYALGAMLLAIVTGAPPPHDPSQATASLERAAAPPALAAICRCALAPSAADRYANVGALAEDIARFREHRPVSVHRESAVERVARFARTYQTPILLVLAYIVMRALIAFFAGI